MRNIFIYFLPLFFIACNGQSDPIIEKTNDEQGVVQDSVITDTVFTDKSIYTAEAAIEGPDDELWIFEPGEWEGEVLNPFTDDCEMLHIIPYEGNTQSIATEMSYVNLMGYQLWGAFDAYTGPVEVYYDREKTTLAAQWRVVEGKPMGIASIYDLNGEVFIRDQFDERGRFNSLIYPYSVKWTFAQKESKLWIQDYTEEDVKKGVYNISNSIHAKEPGDNSLFKIIEKASFTEQFQINDEVFTGKLNGYEDPHGIDGATEFFELNFKDGWLHGDIFLYGYWGELKLHEIFVNGELDSTVFVLDESQMDGMAKPIIYLYPEKEMLINVELDVDGEITHTYPAYKNGWQVLAKPDGTLIDAQGKEYYALYWEGENRKQFTVEEGFVIPGDKTAEFLEKSLDAVGLNRREANEFIVFWLPILEDNPYNLIHFSTEEYQEIAKLKITPKPETLIRVMMVYKPLQSPISIQIQDLSHMKVERKGFTVVEWGGSLLKARPTL